MKKTIAFIFCMIFLLGIIPFASALEWDNVKSVPDNFDMDTDKITISNTFLFLFPTGKVADIRLISNTEQSLIHGKAVFEIVLYEDYPDPINKVEFFNVENKRMDSLRNVKWRYTINETYSYDVPQYERICIENPDSKNLTEFCTNEVTGYEKVTKVRTVWKDYDKQNLKKGTYYFELTADKPISSVTDFIPKMFGVNLPEFAWWDSDWKNRKEVNITVINILSEFPKLINVTRIVGGMNATFTDVRFVDGACSGTQDTELVYDFDSNETNSAMFWVLLNSTTAGKNQICMYYNNSVANSAEDPVTLWADTLNATGVYHFTDDSFNSSTGIANATGANSFRNELIDGSFNVAGAEILTDNSYTFNETLGFSGVAFINFDATTQNGFVFRNTGTEVALSLDASAKPYLAFELDYSCDNCSAITTGNPTPLTFTINQSRVCFVLNGTYGDDYCVGTVTHDYANKNITIGAAIGGGNDMDGGIMELQIYREPKELIWLSEMAQNINFSNVVFGSQELSQSISILQSMPADGNITTDDLSVKFQCNYTAVSTTLETAIVYVNLFGGANEFTRAEPMSGTSDVINWTITLTTNQNYSWFCYGNNTGNTVSSTTGNFSLNTSIPTLSTSTSLNTIDALSTVNMTNQLSANSTVTFGQLRNITYYLWNSTSGLIDTEVINVAGWNSTNVTYGNLSANGLGTFYWNGLTCGFNNTGTSCNFAGNNRSIVLGAFLEDTFFFNVSSFETEEQEFEFNMTVGTTITTVSSSLIYNGTSYPSIVSCVSEKCSIKNTIDIPLVLPSTLTNQNKSFHWQIAVFSADSDTPVFDNSTFQQQNVTQINFGNCNESNIGATALNLTILIEENITKIDSSLGGTFKYYLGNGTVYKTNYTNPSVQNYTFKFCIDRNLTYRVTSDIDISKGGYASRRYDFITESYTNQTTSKNLYLLDSLNASSIIVDVKDQGLIPLKGWLVQFSRFYPEYGEYKLTGSQLTDSFGQLVDSFVENNIKYKFEFYDGSKTIRKTSPDIRIACRSSICIIPFVIEETTTYFDTYTNLTSYISTLTFNNNTNKFTFSWDDKRGESPTHRLEVIRYLFNGTTTICNTTSTAKIGVFTCGVGSQKASYTAQAFRKIIGGTERRIASLNAKVGDISGLFGMEGLFWIFILLFTLIGVGSFHPAIGVTLYLVGFIAFGLLGIISFNLSIFVANAVIGILWIWAFRS